MGMAAAKSMNNQFFDQKFDEYNSPADPVVSPPSSTPQGTYNNSFSPHIAATNTDSTYSLQQWIQENESHINDFINVSTDGTNQNSNHQDINVLLAEVDIKVKDLLQLLRVRFSALFLLISLGEYWKTQCATAELFHFAFYIRRSCDS